MLLCFTDLDGTLLNHDDYRYDAAVPIIQKLQAAGMPVIPTTSKTRAEVIDLRQALKLNDPFIVENGSGIWMDIDDDRFAVEAGAIADSVPIPLTLGQDGELQTITLGSTYDEARAGLKALSEDLGETLRGFGDMDEAELIAATQLAPEDIRRACDRQFSEPFLRPKTDLSQLQTAAARRGFKILVGNRFCHLLGMGAAKGRAVQLLKQAWQPVQPSPASSAQKSSAHKQGANTEKKNGTNITTLGLGDSPNDLSMLESVDIAIVIPGVQGPHQDLIPHIEKHGWRVAPQPGSKGWAAVVGEIAENFDVF